MEEKSGVTEFVWEKTTIYFSEQLGLHRNPIKFRCAERMHNAIECNHLNVNNGGSILTFRLRVKLSDHTFQTVVPQLALRA